MALVAGKEVIPGGVNNLPKWGGAGAAVLVDGRHNCSLKQLWGHKVSSDRCYGTIDRLHPVGTLVAKCLGEKRGSQTLLRPTSQGGHDAQ